MTNKDGTNPNTIANILKNMKVYSTNTKTQQYVKSQIFYTTMVNTLSTTIDDTNYLDPDKILENILAQQDNTEFNDATHTFWINNTTRFYRSRDVYEQMNDPNNFNKLSISYLCLSIIKTYSEILKLNYTTSFIYYATMDLVNDQPAQHIDVFKEINDILTSSSDYLSKYKQLKKCLLMMRKTLNYVNKYQVRDSETFLDNVSDRENSLLLIARLLGHSNLTEMENLFNLYGLPGNRDAIISNNWFYGSKLDTYQSRLSRFAHNIANNIPTQNSPNDQSVSDYVNQYAISFDFRGISRITPGWELCSSRVIDRAQRRAQSITRAPSLQSTRVVRNRQTRASHARIPAQNQTGLDSINDILARLSRIRRNFPFILDEFNRNIVNHQNRINLQGFTHNFPEIFESLVRRDVRNISNFLNITNDQNFRNMVPTLQLSDGKQLLLILLLIWKKDHPTVPIPTFEQLLINLQITNSRIIHYEFEYNRAVRITRDIDRMLQSRGLYSEATDSDPATDWISVLLGDIQISHELIDEILEFNEGPEPQAVSQTQVASASDAARAQFIASQSATELEKDEILEKLGERCTICMDNMIECDLGHPDNTAHHITCKECATYLSYSQSECPICRQPIVSLHSNPIAELKYDLLQKLKTLIVQNIETIDSDIFDKNTKAEIESLLPTTTQEINNLMINIENNINTRTQPDGSGSDESRYTLVGTDTFDEQILQIYKIILSSIKESMAVFDTDHTPGSEPEPESGSEPEPESGSEPEPESGSEPGSGSGSEPGSGSVSDQRFDFNSKYKTRKSQKRSTKKSRKEY